MATAGTEDMEPWMAWTQKCGAGLVDMGAPLGNSILISPGGSKKGNDLIVGYSTDRVLYTGIIGTLNLTVALLPVTGYPILFTLSAVRFIRRMNCPIDRKGPVFSSSSSA